MKVILSLSEESAFAFAYGDEILRRSLSRAEPDDIDPQSPRNGGAPTVGHPHLYLFPSKAMSRSQYSHKCHSEPQAKNLLLRSGSRSETADPSLSLRMTSMRTQRI